MEALKKRRMKADAKRSKEEAVAEEKAAKERALLMKDMDMADYIKFEMIEIFIFSVNYFFSLFVHFREKQKLAEEEARKKLEAMKRKSQFF